MKRTLISFVLTSLIIVFGVSNVVAESTIGNCDDSSGGFADFYWNNPPDANHTNGNNSGLAPVLSDSDWDIDDNDLPVAGPTIGRWRFSG